MATSPQTDFFALTGAVPCLANNATEATVASGAPEVLTAGGAGDGVKIVGNTVDRFAQGWPQSALLVVQSYLNLADTETLSLAVEIQESADGSTWDTAEAIAASTVVKTADGAFTDIHVESYTIHLGDRKRYIRLNVTPTLSAANTDVATVHGVLVLGGCSQPGKLTAHEAEDTAF